jgi:site-specific DNA-methyltransferase (adenine-specific)/modification methylase
LFLPICTGAENKINNKKAHSTQKPLALLYRILHASTKPGDIVSGSVFGTGTQS